MVERTSIRGRRERARKPATRPENFYRSVLAEAEAGSLLAAGQIDGLADEVAALRLLLRRQLTEEPENIERIFKGLHLLVRMVSAQFALSSVDESRLEERLAELAAQFRSAIFEATNEG